MAEKRAIQLHAEGVQLDIAEEVELVAPADPAQPAMSDEAAENHWTRVKTKFQRIPQDELIQTARVSAGGKRGATKEQMEKATRMAARFPGGYEEALAKVMGG
jgi:hypothetical protein